MSAQVLPPHFASWCQIRGAGPNPTLLIGTRGMRGLLDVMQRALAAHGPASADVIRSSPPLSPGRPKLTGCEIHNRVPARLLSEAKETEPSSDPDKAAQIAQARTSSGCAAVNRASVGTPIAPER